MDPRDAMSTSFGRVAGTYEVGRPEYPAAAVSWLLAPVESSARRVRVADAGAGTGKLTRVLVELGAEVVAVDPDPEMLAELRTRVAAVPTFVGTAERMPLPDASVDAVVLGQAWHWVEPVAGSLEVGRVLRPGGVLGLIWNVRDESIPWVRRLTAIMHGSRAEEMLAEGGPTVGEPFGDVDEAEWRWKRPVTRDALFAMVRSRSYIITASDDERARIEAELEVLFDELGAIGDRLIDLPYVTRAFRALRP